MNFEALDNLSAILHRLECGASLLEAIHDCMKRDTFTSGDLAPAVYATYEYFSGTVEELRRLCADNTPAE